LLARAVCGHIRSECEQLFVSTVARDQISQSIPARASAFRALDAQHVELVDQVAEDDRAVAGHLDSTMLRFAPAHRRTHQLRAAPDSTPTPAGQMSCGNVPSWTASIHVASGA